MRVAALVLLVPAIAAADNKCPVVDVNFVPGDKLQIDRPKQAERYTAHGQLVMAMQNWRLAEAMGDAMKDSMALQTELKRPGVTEASLAETHKHWVARHVARVSDGTWPALRCRSASRP